jgi:hypothetical protein
VPLSEVVFESHTARRCPEKRAIAMRHDGDKLATGQAKGKNLPYQSL